MLGTCHRTPQPGHSIQSNAGQHPGIMKQDLPSTEMVPSSAALDYLNSFNFSLGDLDFGSEMAGLEYGFIGDMVQTTQPPSTTPAASSSTLLTPWNTSTSFSGPMIGTGYPTGYSTSTPLPSSLTPQVPQQPISPTPTSQPFLSPSSSSPPQQRSRQKQKEPHQVIPKQSALPDRPIANQDKPFNYADGFHYLIQYVKEKMNRDDLMRISRALAKFRPSFLVLIMNLTEEDLIFMEKCIQRTLLRDIFDLPSVIVGNFLPILS
ncbi:hypothetical protein [Absidia glauca]|uniref:Uncharacterized protein n=1 Tax=Absidia glauca TaxID=4829 RepID=A0A168Q6T8_ABSGL|nr:hypothetical protein [Absidia glauca]